MKDLHGHGCKHRRTIGLQALVVSRLLLLIAACMPGTALASVFGERVYEFAPAEVLPGAAEFVRKDTYWEAYGPGADGSRSVLGYVFLTDDLVEVPGYSGHTLNTLVGMTRDGAITGIKIVRHSEPIVLIGLNEKVIHDFVAQYVGKNIRQRIIISDEASDEFTAVDGISGATVTAVAENATILEAGRNVGRKVGIVRPFEIRSRRPTQRFASLTWDELVAQAALGHLIVRPADIGQTGDAPLLDLTYALVDAPGIGRNLLGERYYDIVRDRLKKEGGSALFIGASGSISFKGAGFARGGIFDRFSVEQRGDLFVFRDVDYLNFAELPIEGAPLLHEGGIFFLHSDAFDPTVPFTLHITLPYRAGDKKLYRTFLDNYRLPEEFVDVDAPFWLTRWQASAPAAVAFALFLGLVALAFAFRQRLVRHRKLLHRTVAVVAAVWVGLLLKAQPSTTQILTLTNSAVRLKFPYETFLAEPLIFLFWIAIALSLFVWGRGFFCGWLCPYGALLEVLIAVWQRIAPAGVRRRLETWEPGPRWRWGKYLTFAIILVVGFVDLPAAEMLDEVEPFKTFVLHLQRPASFVAYFAAITILSVVSYRFFCRFLCPLGGALAISGRKPLVPLFRYETCSTCKICYKGCEPKAISRATGRIDYAECLQCWDCQMTGKREDLCPELIVAKRRGTAPRFAAAAFALGICLAPRPGAARTWKVSPASPLAAAIAASAAGDTIRVEAGVYRENVVIDKPLILLGAAGAVIDAGGSGNALVVSSANVRVEGLTLRGSGRDIEHADAGIRVEQRAADVHLVGNRIEECRFGIWIHGGENVTISGNTITGMAALSREDRGDCIHLWNARGALIEDNTLSDCRDGVYLELSNDGAIRRNSIRGSRFSVHTMWCDRTNYEDNTATENLVGLALMFSKRFRAKGNVLYGNATHGILLTQVTRSEVTGNTIIGNTKGLFVYNSLYNTIRDNLVARNNMGLHYWGGSEENEVDGNAFIENEIQVKFVAAFDQVWNGNFWSDYLGWDVDGNGRGDLPYRSNSLADALLWKYPAAKLLLASPALQVLALAERDFPVLTFPKGVDPSPLMVPVMANWGETLARYPRRSLSYYGDLTKLPHVPAGG